MSSSCDDSGMQVYRRNYQQGHIEALEYKYPGTFMAIGAEGFRYAAYHFLQKYPPRTEDVSNFGEMFSSFLKHNQDFEEYPQLSWLARLDLWFFEKKPSSSITLPYGTLKLRCLLLENKDVEGEWGLEAWETVEYDESAAHYRVQACCVA
ncbi:MAG: putative DNA-binding domain-containing protein [Oligoflexales bacterium]